jgi:membrane-associated phospholipid phosphatase
MFQTASILKLQDFFSERAVLLMQAISALGSVPFFACVIFIILLGIDYKRGLFLLRLLLCASLASDLLKLALALPRPFIADSRIRNFEGWSSPSSINDAGGGSFFSLPKPRAIELYRSLYSPHFGFPSSHLTGSTSLLCGIHSVYRKKAFLIGFPSLVAMLAISRMYLGVHFLADVLGGIMVGLFFFYIFDIIGKIDGARIERRISSASGRNASMRIGISLVFVLLPAAAGLAFSGDHCREAGCLAGANAASLLIRARETDWSSDRPLKRAMRVSSGILLFFILVSLSRAAIDSLFGSQLAYQADFLKYLISSFLSVLGACKIRIKRRILRPPNASSPAPTPTGE